MTMLHHQDVGVPGATDRSAEQTAPQTQLTLATLESDVRTPMQNILGLSDLLLDSALDSKQRGYANIIRDSTEQLVAILNDLIDDAKLRDGSFKLSSEIFDITALVESVAGASADASSGVSVLVDIAPDVPARLRGDTARLRQILSGLVAELVSRRPDELVIAVEQRPGDAGDAKLMLRFVLTAYGQLKASPDVNQLPNARNSLASRVRSGIIQRLGGSLTSRNLPDPGYEVAFDAILEAPGVSVTSEVTEPDGEASVLSHLRVLIVDDSKPTREILARYVAAWKMKCRGVSNATDAMAVLRDAASAGSPFDVAVIDYRLPGLNGFDVASMIKSDRRFASMALILLTGSDDLLAHSAEKAGFSAYLTKPVRQSTLFDAISTVFLAERMPEVLTRRGDLPVRANPPTVLLVEDNLANQKLAMAQLESMGCQVRAVNNGHDAVREVAVSGDQYALVLMDCQMPTMDGYAATHQIRNAEKLTGQHIPIVAMTANAMQGAREECLLAGMDDYLSKPVSRELLRDMVRKWAR